MLGRTNLEVVRRYVEPSQKTGGRLPGGQLGAAEPGGVLEPGPLRQPGSPCQTRIARQRLSTTCAQSWSGRPGSGGLGHLAPQQARQLPGMAHNVLYNRRVLDGEDA